MTFAPVNAAAILAEKLRKRGLLRIVTTPVETHKDGRVTIDLGQYGEVLMAIADAIEEAARQFAVEQKE